MCQRSAMSTSTMSSSRPYSTRRSHPPVGFDRKVRGGAAMAEPQVVRLEDTAIVKFGPDSFHQPIIGDDEGTTPIRTGIQTAEPGYAAPMHSHPYLEVLHILDGVAEAW